MEGLLSTGPTPSSFQCIPVFPHYTPPLKNFLTLDKLQENIFLGTPRTSSESCGVLLFSAGQEVTGHQTSATMSFCQFVDICLLTLLYYTGFSNINFMQTRPGGYKIPYKPFENSSLSFKFINFIFTANR